MAKRLCVCLALAVALSPAVGRTSVTYAASCLMTIRATFNPALTNTSAFRTMSLNTVFSACVGTDPLPPATGPTGFVGYPTWSATSATCASITPLNGFGSLAYASAATANVAWSYFGGVAGGLVTFVPDPDQAAGVGTFVDLNAADDSTKCLGPGVSTVTMMGSMTFTDPTL